MDDDDELLVWLVCPRDCPRFLLNLSSVSSSAASWRENDDLLFENIFFSVFKSESPSGKRITKNVSMKKHKQNEADKRAHMVG